MSYIISYINRLMCSFAHKTHVLQSLDRILLKPTNTFYDQQHTFHSLQRKRWTFFHYHNFAHCWTAAHCWKLGDLNFAVHSLSCVITQGVAVRKLSLLDA